MSEPLVLDTSAILAYLEDEEGADQVQRWLRDAEAADSTLLCSFVSLTELRYIATQEQGEAAADRLLAIVSAWPVRWVHSDEALCRRAAQIKARHRVSLADAFVAATALAPQAALVHKDPEFETLSGEVELGALPYK